MRRRHKYGAKKTWVTKTLELYVEPPGLTPEELEPSRDILRKEEALCFDSKLEATRFIVLVGYRKDNVITDLKRQISYDVTWPGSKKKQFTYKADFVYTQDGKEVVEDVKGMETSTWRLKWKFLNVAYPNVIWRVVKRESINHLEET